MISRMFLTILFLSVIAGSASSDDRACYWNAPGLPYSAVPLSEPGTTIDGGPLEVIFAVYMNAPELPFKAACGVVEAQDIRPAREFYMRFGCFAQSSVGKMIEGLPHGGPFVWEGMTVVPRYLRNHPKDAHTICDLFDALPTRCSLRAPIEGDPRDDAERIHAINKKIAREDPECAALWPRIEQAMPVLLRMYEAIGEERETIRRDRERIQSAGIE